ncbi:caspase family protein [Aquisphaera insulae]|uniref:caspase family protein n=1 Tax=Aquisphaera insulae TaxID=2712864 RepID=UPI0013EABB6E|nr:caspase family protein [Aquisphaera insulae]
MTIGLNRLSPTAYPGAPPLRGAVNDARDVFDIARLQGFECKSPLLDEAATASAVISGIEDAARELRQSPGGIFLIQYAGHGCQVPDRNSDEPDGLDETWCLYDRMLLDDELGRLWTRFPRGTRILMISDSCHSGSVARGADDAFVAAVQRAGAGRGDDDKEKILKEVVFRYLPSEVAMAAYQQQRTVLNGVSDTVGSREMDDQGIEASVLLLSGCQDNQLSADLHRNGLFTSRLKEVWNDGKFNRIQRPNYRSFHSAIVSRMPMTQCPNFYPIGEPNIAFWMQKPFTI